MTDMWIEFLVYFRALYVYGIIVSCKNKRLRKTSISLFSRFNRRSVFWDLVSHVGSSRIQPLSIGRQTIFTISQGLAVSHWSSHSLYSLLYMCFIDTKSFSFVDFFLFECPCFHICPDIIILLSNIKTENRNEKWVEEKTTRPKSRKQPKKYFVRFFLFKFIKISIEMHMIFILKPLVISMSWACVIYCKRTKTVLTPFTSY